MIKGEKLKNDQNYNVTTTDTDSIPILLTATQSEKQHLFLLIEWECWELSIVKKLFSKNLKV